MKLHVFVVGFLILAVNGSLPTPIPPNFTQTTHIISKFETNITSANYFNFNCPYNDKDIIIKSFSYKFQSNSSNFTILTYNSNTNSVNVTNSTNWYWQLTPQYCSYYCEANYTFYYNATQCFIFSGFDSYNDTMLISYEMVEEYVGPFPDEPVPSPPTVPENPPTNVPDEPALLSPGAIAGIVIGCLAFIGLVVGLTVFFVKKYNQDASRN